MLEHLLVFATGVGRNGKGVLYESVIYVLGDYGAIGAEGKLEYSKSNANGPSPAMADLRGLRLVVLSETEEGARFSAARLKRLTGGDPIKARQLNKGFFIFDASHMLLHVSNFLPVLPADDPAVWERSRVVKFDVVIPKEDRDPLLKEKIEADGDALLAMLVAGLHQYWERGLDEPEAVRVATAEFAKSQDLVARFVDEDCETGDFDGDTVTEFFRRLRSWGIDEGISEDQLPGRKKVSEQLERLGFHQVKTRAGMAWRGLRWMDPRDVMLRDAQQMVNNVVQFPAGEASQPQYFEG